MFYRPTNGKDYAQRVRTTPDPRKIVARNLRLLMDKARDEGDMDRATAQRLEAICGVSDAAIYNFLKGDRAIDIVRLTKIAAVYGLAPWELLRSDFDPANTPANKEANLEDAIKAVRERLNRMLNGDQ